MLLCCGSARSCTHSERRAQTLATPPRTQSAEAPGQATQGDKGRGVGNFNGQGRRERQKQRRWWRLPPISEACCSAALHGKDDPRGRQRRQGSRQPGHRACCVCVCTDRPTDLTPHHYTVRTDCAGCHEQAAVVNPHGAARRTPSIDAGVALGRRLEGAGAKSSRCARLCVLW